MNVQDMLKIYVPYSGLDWMNYDIIDNKLSFHHIIKKCDGGKKKIENGAILQSETSHPYLHLIEYIDINYYKELNKIFKIINNQRCEPTIEQRILIEEILKDFEDRYKWKKSQKGDLLIKTKYRKRSVI